MSFKTACKLAGTIILGVLATAIATPRVTLWAAAGDRMEEAYWFIRWCREYQDGMAIIVAVTAAVLIWRPPRKQPGVDLSAAIRKDISRAVDGDFSLAWCVATRNMLKGALGARYAREFDASLWDDNPETASKAYLRGLSNRVDGRFMRSSRLAREKESHRLEAAFDMIRELIEGAPQLDARFTEANRRGVVEWREKCITTLQELLAEQHAGAWQKVLAALGVVESQCPDEVRCAVKAAAIHLRAIYSKLDEIMLSKEFVLTNGQYNAVFPINRN